MAKYGELWDDSALVKALDDAVSKYKMMHGKGGDNGSLKDNRITKGTEEIAPSVFDGSNEAKSAYVETNDNITDIPKNTTHTIEATNSSVTENITSEAIDQHASQSKGDQVQNTDCTYVNAESTQHYNLLLNQYNAVEEQRQKLLQQLYQYGNWDYQGYGYGATYDSQYHNGPAPQTSEPPLCSCRPYLCTCSIAPCTSLAAVSSCENCVGKTVSAHDKSSVSLEHDGIIKAAMGAVDRAIHSVNKETSGMSDVNQEGKKVQEVETGSQDTTQEKTSQTDLSAVLNAWFSAGFYTGKYLSEQTSAKK